MYEQYENDFQFAVKLPGGRIVYRLEKDEADAARAAIKHLRPIPPPKARRMLPFGEGVKAIGDQFDCSFQGAHLGLFKTLKEALTIWDEVEREERFKQEQDAVREAIDRRYYGDLTYDEDGYKVFTPRPLG